MARDWVDYTFQLSEEDWVFVSVEDCREGFVNLKAPGYGRDGTGFVIKFLTAQIPQVRELLKNLEKQEGREEMRQKEVEEMEQKLSEVKEQMRGGHES